jgi:hypothetical protein
MPETTASSIDHQTVLPNQKQAAMNTSRVTLARDREYDGPRLAALSCLLVAEVALFWTARQARARRKTGAALCGSR